MWNASSQSRLISEVATGLVHSTREVAKSSGKSRIGAAWIRSERQISASSLIRLACEPTNSASTSRTEATR